VRYTLPLVTVLLLALLTASVTKAQTAPAKPATAGKSTIATVSKSTPELPRKSEGDVIELTDGRLFLVSMEFGGDGSDFASSLTAPESCPELTRIPGTSDLLMIWNNSYDPKFRSHFGKRSPLTAAVSKDHGKTWQHVRDIETSPTRAFSNPGCRFTRDGRAIINYWTCEYLPNWAMQDVIDLRVAVIDKSWFYDEPASGDSKDKK
jgi:hypothetical protein